MLSKDIRDLSSESGKQARRTEYGLKEDQNLLFTVSGHVQVNSVTHVGNTLPLFISTV